MAGIQSLALHCKAIVQDLWRRALCRGTSPRPTVGRPLPTYSWIPVDKDL